MRESFLLFAHTFAVQSAYTAHANAQGRLEDRLARWLLMAQAGSDPTNFYLRMNFLALMLGVRRAGVTTGLNHFDAKRLRAASTRMQQIAHDAHGSRYLIPRSQGEGPSRARWRIGRAPILRLVLFRTVTALYGIARDRHNS